MASVLRMNDENANVMLISCDGTTIKAHANLLRQCPYFANALHTNSKNSTDVVIEVPDGVDGDDLKLFLRAEIYNDGDIPEADFPRYSELLGIFGEEGVVGNDASDAEEESESELSFSDDGIIEDVDATTIARPINGAGAAESGVIFCIFIVSFSIIITMYFKRSCRNQTRSGFHVLVRRVSGYAVHSNQTA